MNDVRLASLALEGFRSFRSKQKVTFPAKGMVLLRGRSGHGKSNLALGISYALDYCPRAGTVLKSWDWETKWGVKLGVTTESGPLTIENGSKFTLQAGEETIGGSAASKRAYITKAIGLEPELLGALTYRPQRTFGLFLSMQDDAKKEFLAKLLGLDKFESEAEAAEKKFPDLDRVVVEWEQAVAREETIEAHLKAQEFPVEDATQAVENLRIAKEKHNEITGAHSIAQKELTICQGFARAEASNTYQAGLIEADRLEDDFSEVRAQRPPLPEVVITAEEERIQELLTKAATFLKKFQADDRAKQNKVEAQRNELHQKISTTRAGINSEIQVRKQLSDLEHKLQHATQTTTCPTCKQEWRQGKEKNGYVASLVNDISQQKVALQTIESARASLAVLELELKGLVFTPDPTIEKLLKSKSQAEQKLAVERANARTARSTLQAQYATEDANQKVAVLNAKALAEQARRKVEEEHAQKIVKVEQGLRLLAEDLQQLQSRMYVADGSLSIIQTKNAEAIKARAKRDSDLQKVVETLETYRARLASEKAKAGQERDLAGVVRAYLGVIVEEVLVEIAHETNKVLARVPNVQTTTLAFKTEVEAKTTGKKRSKITPIVRVDGVERPFTDLSGGQTSVVELATDIAIRRVVSNRRQVHIGWMVLDEAFDGLGKVEKESVFEILALAAQEDLILVIDHSSELQDFFTTRYEVEMVDGESRIR